MTLREILAGARETGTEKLGGLVVTIPQDWLQGRTAYGGFSAAFGHLCARRIAPDAPSLKSAQIAFVGPLAGEVEFHARVLRVGRSASWVAVEATAGPGEVVMRATYLFRAAAESMVAWDDAPRPPDDLVPLESARDIDTAKAPAFVQNHVRMRHARPPATAPDAEITRWVQCHGAGEMDAQTRLLLIADALPPAVLPLTGFKGPGSSMTWQCDLLRPEAVIPDGWILLRSIARHAADGTSSQDMAMWNASGDCLATGTQSVAVFA